MQRRHHLLRRGDPGPADGALPSHFLLDSVARSPFIQAAAAERMAAGQVQRVLRVLEAYSADDSSATYVFGHAAPVGQPALRRAYDLPLTPIDTGP
ncbi:hypothetical protein THAOC_27463, partial [Thalassiosira oceanica]